MSFRETLCVRERRAQLCEGIRQSLMSIPLDEEVRKQLTEMLTAGTAVQQIYLIIFAIVRLGGLYEIIAEQSSPCATRMMESLYYVLNDHLMGDCEEGTDAYIFVRKMVLMADYLQ